MTILAITHVTTYRYARPVAFGEHRMMLRPRDDGDQRILQSELEITPEPRALDWSRDAFGNHVAIAQFAERAAELSFVSTIRLVHDAAEFRAGDIEPYARTCPFHYAAQDRPGLVKFMTPSPRQAELERWTAQFFASDNRADTHDLLVGMTKTIKRTFKHVARHEKGIQSPAQTLSCGTGSCRDVALLMIAALRSRGIAARFVSGYMKFGDDDAAPAGGNTHAWVQAYVPGPGWVDFDPSAGIVGNENLVRVAVVDHPREAIPLQGTWFGSAADHLAMNVAVKVTAAYA